VAGSPGAVPKAKANHWSDCGTEGLGVVSPQLGPGSFISTPPCFLLQARLLPLLPKGKLTWRYTTPPHPHFHLRVTQDTEKEQAAAMGQVSMLGRWASPDPGGPGRLGWAAACLERLVHPQSSEPPSSALSPKDGRLRAEPQPTPDLAWCRPEAHVRKQAEATGGL